VFLVRILGLATAIALGVSVMLWALTGERRWLRFAWRIFRYAVFVILLVLLLFLGERFLLIV
jgi:cell division protein FtsW (lipid II flippase)